MGWQLQKKNSIEDFSMLGPTAVEADIFLQSTSTCHIANRGSALQ